MRHSLFVILHNIRSAHNVGSIFRTADGAGAQRVFLTGYTPAPATGKEIYLTRAQKDLAKTALGAEKSLAWEKSMRLLPLLQKLKQDGFQIVALEQSANSVEYQQFTPKGNVALVVGNEVRGLDRRTLAHCDAIIELPMRGEKNSLNVSVAFGIAAYAIAGTMEEG